MQTKFGAFDKLGGRKDVRYAAVLNVAQRKKCRETDGERERHGEVNSNYKEIKQPREKRPTVRDSDRV